LRTDFEEGRIPGELAGAVGSSQPFYLAYQGSNDRDLQRVYGEAMCRAVANAYPEAPIPPPPGPEEKVRVGIVAGLFRHHTVWKLMIKGWLTQLDRNRFQVFGYHTAAPQDEWTGMARQLCDRFVQGPLTPVRWREKILADAPHVLLYPDIGMDTGAGQLAAHRLAPVQCMSFGHPNTSGYPTIDYFLSSALMEPADADEHYTERLVRLPNLAFYYEPLAAKSVAAERAALGFRPEATVFWSGQSLFKYLPQFDQIYARIARDVRDCQFAFIEFRPGHHVTDVFRSRLDRAFGEFGLRAADHCVFLPRLPTEVFIAAIGQCDVVLDTPGWSGGNTTLEGLTHGVPIVTMPGPLMRGRVTMAILQRLGVTETIAETIDDYVSIAVRLAQDGSWRKSVRQRIAENKHRIYCDRECITALEDFLWRAARGEHLGNALGGR
jgi:predicted O-linked N-acetylglucosamine transferase (SPINDLY family)